MENMMGDIPTWLTAIVAIVAATVGLGQYRDQVKVNKGVAERDRRKQASQLASWMVAEYSDSGSDKKPRWGLLIRNSSDLTFSNVRIQAHFDSRTVQAKVITLPPGDVFLPKNPQSSAFDFSYPEFVANLALDYKPISSNKYRILASSFKDNQGQKWSVDESGLLRDAEG
ncbi:hypothetical protein [Arthrobacter rhombi]|uniref:hypothetical protein n=1 Tax=Arthrobacter rhombi TaxID=71253 RepID=UPI003F92BACA